MVVQILGASLVLAAFVLSQRGLLDSRSSAYLVPNLVGSAALAVDAALGREWGFLLLEGAWALVSAGSLYEKSRLAAALQRERRDSNPRPPA